MNIILSLFLSTLVSALGKIGVKLITPEFFEAILTRVIIWAAEHLAPMTTNTLDDAMVVELKKRLQKDVEQ